ncbi:hypothetical protein ACFL0Q_02325 [Thermodesulfobacteriota bacterium]
MSQKEIPGVALPRPIEAGPSPLLPQHLIDLFIRPHRFFSGQLALGNIPHAVLIAWCYGASTGINKIEQNLLRAEIGRPRPGWDQLAPYLVDWWPGFWAYLLVFGALSGLMLWWLGGWWFSVRLRWSGAINPERRMARLVMVYSAFVHAGPTVAAALVYTAFFDNYAEAFSYDEPFSLILLIFPFWSVAASFTGVRSVFGVSGWRPRLWFLVLPILVYIVSLGVVVSLITLLGDTSAA